MKKQILLISLMVFSMQSITAQDADFEAVDEEAVEEVSPSWYQQKQQQLYGFGQRGWEKTKEGIAWIKANPKKAAALGLGAAAVVGAGIYGAKRRRQKRATVQPYVPQWVQDARAERNKFINKIKEYSLIHKLWYNLWLPDLVVRMYNAENTVVKNISAMSTLPQANLAGYSVIGAIIISPNFKPREKQQHINTLLHYGFAVKPTSKDCMLSKLEWWERKVSKKAEIEQLIAGIQSSPMPTYFDIYRLVCEVK